MPQSFKLSTLNHLLQDFVLRFGYSLHSWTHFLKSKTCILRQKKKQQIKPHDLYNLNLTSDVMAGVECVWFRKKQPKA